MNQTLVMESAREESLDRAGLQSATIDFLRFPMAVAVVMIHMTPNVVPLGEADFPLLSSEGLYNVVAMSISHVLARIAVPVFFLISGLLFFLNIRQLNWGGYRRKLSSRLHTLIIPYLLWNLLPFMVMAMTEVAIGIKHGHGLANLWGYLTPETLDIFWDSNKWNLDNVNILGIKMISTGPYDLPLWFLRDLIVVVIFSPAIYWFVKKTRIVGLLLLFAAYYLQIWIPLPGFSVTAFFYFSLGAYFSIEGKSIIGFVRANRYVISIGALLFFVPSVYFDGSFTPEGKWLSNAFVIFGVFAAFLVAASLVEYKGWRANRFLVSACFFIYALHGVAALPIYGVPLSMFNYFVGLILPQSSEICRLVAYFVVPAVTIAFCAGVYAAMRRLLPGLTKVLSGGR